MWSARRRSISENWGEIIELASRECPLTMAGAIAGWRGDDAFRDFFVRELAATEYPAFFWEMPPVTQDSLSSAFECAVIRSEALAHLRADDSDFAAHLKAT